MLYLSLINDRDYTWEISDLNRDVSVDKLCWIKKYLCLIRAIRNINTYNIFENDINIKLGINSYPWSLQKLTSTSYMRVPTIRGGKFRLDHQVTLSFTRVVSVPSAFNKFILIKSKFLTRKGRYLMVNRFN